jgi:adenylate kinase
MLNLVIFGPPGAGKGTQSDKLIAKYNLVHISTGDLFREHKEKKTELGKKIIEYMDKGVLVPDSITIDMLKEVLDSNKNAAGFIFDGFPRTVPQAEALDSFMKENHTAIHAVVALDVTETEVRNRIEKRRIIEKRTDDQETATVDRRIGEYFSKTVHVLPYYEQQKRLTKVNGIGDVEVIFTHICEDIEKAKKA